MTYDDMKPSVTCQFKKQVPTIPPSEVHIVLWESRPLASGDVLLKSPIQTPATPSRLTIAQSPRATGVNPVVPQQLLYKTDATATTQLDKRFVDSPSKQSSPCLANSVMPPSAHQNKAAPFIRTSCHLSTVETPPLTSNVDNVEFDCGEDRLQRARERFLKDKKAATVPAFVTVVPPPAKLMPSQAYGVQLKSEVTPGKCKATPVPEDRVGVAHVKRRQPTSRSAAFGAEKSTTIQPSSALASRMSAAKFRSSVRNPYEAVLPLIHKTVQKNYSTTVYNSFSGYVPKAHRAEPSKNGKSSTSSDGSEATVEQQNLDEFRKPKVCFSLPPSGTALSDVSPSLAGSETKLPCVNSSSIKHKLAAQTTDKTGVETSVEKTETPKPVFESPPVDAGFIDDLSNLCDEIISCETFDHGVLSEQLLTSNLIDAEIKSDIVTVGNNDTPVKDDVQMPECIEEFTFDDMMAYLLH